MMRVKIIYDISFLVEESRIMGLVFTCSLGFFGFGMGMIVPLPSPHLVVALMASLISFAKVAA